MKYYRMAFIGRGLSLSLFQVWIADILVALSHWVKWSEVKCVNTNENHPLFVSHPYALQRTVYNILYVLKS